MVEPVTYYRASDGKEFADERQAEAYEQIVEFNAVIGLQPSDIVEVLAGCQRELGDAIEKLAGRIAKKRLENGGSKRRSKPKLLEDKSAPEGNNAD